MGGWNDSTEVIVAGGGGQVYFAPYGTTLPRRGDRPTAALNAAFVGVGYNTEDGVSLSSSMDIMEVNAWQSQQAIRREKTGQDLGVRFAIQQWNETNIVFAFGGGNVIDHGGGIYSYRFPDISEGLDERSLVIDANDGTSNYRFVFPRGTIGDAIETQFQRRSAAIIPVNFRLLLPDNDTAAGYMLTDAPGFAAGS